ncbi:DUF4145 domain-containing protein [Sphingomonas aurantiaca]|nr:DUF4145 domain-containing protein [Sphingomonas aurantiaca]
MVGGDNAGNPLGINGTVHTCPNCKGATVELTFYNGPTVYSVLRSYPRTGPFPPPPPDVPKSISLDYSEANEVLPISPKASAALARRCLQGILSSHSYTGRDLMKQIESALSEADAAKALPSSLRENIDAIRNFGNFSAHPITDQTTLQVVEVEEGEAEWCLQLLLDLFDHYYVAPAKAAKQRANLAAKLVAAGKPPMKS